MNKKRAFWLLIGCCIITLASNLPLEIAEAAKKKRLTADLGHMDWEEIEPHYFIATKLVYQQGHLVVFDTFIDPELQYTRFAGDCDAMLVKQLRFGGISGSQVLFTDMRTRSEIEDASAGHTNHQLLKAACEQREL